MAPVMLPSKRPAKLKTTVAAITPITVTVLKNEGLRKISIMFSWDLATELQNMPHMATKPAVASMERPTIYSGFNLKTAVELYYDRLILEFKGIFAKICLTVGWLLLSPNFGKNPFKFGVLAALATSSTAVFRFKVKEFPWYFPKIAIALAPFCLGVPGRCGCA